jgi:hypothetical protein
MDDGFVSLDDEGGVEAFLTACRRLRHWQRQVALLPA